jgi:hypothetical protein
MINTVEEGQLQNADPVRRLVRKEGNQDFSEHCLVIPMLEVFVVIYDSHSVELGHLGDERK